MFISACRRCDFFIVRQNVCVCYHSSNNSSVFTCRFECTLILRAPLMMSNKIHDAEGKHCVFVVEPRLVLQTMWMNESHCSPINDLVLFIVCGFIARRLHWMRVHDKCGLLILIPLSSNDRCIRMDKLIRLNTDLSYNFSCRIKSISFGFCTVRRQKNCRLRLQEWEFMDKTFRKKEVHTNRFYGSKNGLLLIVRDCPLLILKKEKKNMYRLIGRFYH